MQYTDSPKTSTAYLRKALPLLTKHGLAANPVNYAVYYEYIAGFNYALKNEIDKRIKSHQVVSSDFSEQLFEKYLTQSDKIQVRKVQKQARRILTKILEAILRIDDHTLQYGVVLDRYHQQLHEDIAVEDLQNIIKEVIENTGAIRRKYKTLKLQLMESTREVDSLRKELQTVKRQVTHDSLTGLTNREGFYAAAQNAINVLDGAKDSLCLLMADIDHFKQINDTYGHPFGDRVLQQVGSILRNSVKGKDTAARFGGEEFAILLPETPPAGAQQFAENLRSAIEKGKITDSKNGRPMANTTISIGVAAFRPGETLGTFIERADAALYTSKKQGRNCVSCSF